MWPLDILKRRNEQAADNVAAGRPEKVESELLKADPHLANELCSLPPSEYEHQASRNVDHAEWDETSRTPPALVEVGFSIEFNDEDIDILQAAIISINNQFRVLGVSEVRVVNDKIRRNVIGLKAEVPADHENAFFGCVVELARFLGRHQFYALLPNGQLKIQYC